MTVADGSNGDSPTSDRTEIEERLLQELRTRRSVWVTSPQDTRELERQRFLSALWTFHDFQRDGHVPGQSLHPARSSVPQMDGALTKREREVLEKIAEGLTSKQIARDLKIAFKTAVTHRTHLLEKFDAPNAVVLVRRAIAAGYIQP